MNSQSVISTLMNNPPPVQPKVALVTGAGRKDRVGAAIARNLHEKGCNVVLHYNQAEKDVKILCNELNAKRPNSAVTVWANFSSSDLDSVVKNLILQSVYEWGYIDVVINSASLFLPSKPFEMNLKEHMLLMQVNAITPALITQAFAKLWREKGKHGDKIPQCVINISDKFARHPSKYHLAYNASKLALEKMTLDSAETFPNIRVVSLMPGAMLSPDGVEDLGITYEGTQALIQKIWEVINDPSINKCHLLASNGIAAYPEGVFDEKKKTLQM